MSNAIQSASRSLMKHTTNTRATNFGFVSRWLAVAAIICTTMTPTTMMRVHASNDHNDCTTATNAAPGSIRVRLYLIRHGESAANKWGVFAGQEDVPLTEEGRLQAEALGGSAEWLRAPSQGEEEERLADGASSGGGLSPLIWRVYASDLSRAKDTAQYVLESAGRSELVPGMQLEKRLRERSYGPLQGMARTLSEDEALKIWRSHDIEPPIYETDEDLWERTSDWLRQLVAQAWSIHTLETNVGVSSTSSACTYETASVQRYSVMVAAHAGIIRELLLHLFPKEQLDEAGAQYDTSRNDRLIIPNASVSIVEIDPSAKGDPLQTATLVELTNASHLHDVKIYDD